MDERRLVLVIAYLIIIGASLIVPVYVWIRFVR